MALIPPPTDKACFAVAQTHDGPNMRRVYSPGHFPRPLGIAGEEEDMPCDDARSSSKMISANHGVP